MKFKEMPYARPDLEALKAQFSELTERLKAAADCGARTFRNR